MTEADRLIAALKQYDDAIALCAASGPTTEEWETIKEAWRKGLAVLSEVGVS